MVAPVLFWIGLALLMPGTLSWLFGSIQSAKRFQFDLARAVASLGIPGLFFLGAVAAKYIGL